MTDYNGREGIYQPNIPGVQGIPTGQQCSMVDINQPTSSGSDGRCSTTMAHIAEKHQQVFESLAEELQEMGSDFFGYFNGKDCKASYRYISDVITFNSDDNLQRCLEVLREYGRNRRNGLFGFSVETDHIHVIHDCSYYGSHCRDVWRSQIEPHGTIRPVRRYNKPLWKFTITDWYDVFIYFFVQKQSVRELYIRGENGRLPTPSECLRWTGKFEAGGSLFRCCNNENATEHTGQRTKRDSGSICGYSGEEIYGKKAKSSSTFTIIKEKTKILLLKYYCSPISSIKDINEFRNDDWLINPKNKDYVNVAIDDFGKDINNYSLSEIRLVLEKGAPLFFTSMNYDTRENSFIIINDLLRYQFNDDVGEISCFLSNLVDIIDKKLPKTNTLSILSPPSAGKNFFFDMVFAICLNYGQLGFANKNNTFAFQDAPNKRIILWNEPNYESALTDTIKMMFAGDPYTVKVKHQSDCHVSRTPVIVLTNNFVPFLCDPAFNDRIIKYTWKAAPFLKDYEMKPYPMCLFDLFDYYNIKVYMLFNLLFPE